MSSPNPVASSAAPRKVAAGRGADWLGEGFELFRKRPGTWVGILIIWFLLSGVIGSLPVIGIVGPFLGPIFMAGAMLGCASLARGGDLRVEHLFAGFKSGRLGPLLMMTVWTFLLGLAGFVAICIVFVPPALDAFRALPPEPTMADIEAFVFAFGLGRILLLGLAAAALGVLIAMATWFAPPLIVFRGLTSLEAMKLSFRAFLVDWLSLTVYGLLAVGMLIVACIPLGLGLLIAFPVLVASVYTSYRDIFPEPAA